MDQPKQPTVEPGDTTSEYFGALVAGGSSLMTLVVSESDAVKISALAAFVVLALGYCACRTWRKNGGPPKTL